MKNALYVVYNDTNGYSQTAYLYQDIKDFIADTWNPEDKKRVAFKMGFRIKGKTYQEKKANFENIVRDLLDNDVGGLSYYEEAFLYDYLETNARRFGLVTELKENGII
ncbi:MAG: hypothetical protein J6S67_16320 [Methanobrevibacter sp.]|nr:hypothetical protein [Methanobrevibacter sp.]